MSREVRGHNNRYVGVPLPLQIMVAAAFIAAAVAYGLPWLGWRSGRKRVEFTPELTHTITVPPDEQGRPGLTLRSPSISPTVGHALSNGTRVDCSVLIGHLSTLVIACIGRASESWTLDGMVRETLDNTVGSPRLTSAPEPCRIAGEAGVRYTRRFKGGRRVTDWDFQHDGWLYAVRFNRSRRAGPAVEARAQAVIDSWRWLDGSGSAAMTTGQHVTHIAPSGTAP